jgi:anti-sigma regulatory factor (Ser/Thr protein kinase)
MKIRITLKDPDGVYNSVRTAARESLAALKLQGEDLEDAVTLRSEAALNILKPWIRHDEYVTIEIDTNSGAAIVVPNK